ncbi:MAG: hypothetical protein ACFFCE_04860 [Promethearchaeota archaeon]
MVNSVNYKHKRTRISLLFIMALLFGQVFTPQVKADDEDGPLKISNEGWIQIQVNTSTTLFWQFQVNTNELAIYWEILGDVFLEYGWGPDANCTTPILNETGKNYEYTCHGYYAKYHVYSTIIVTCTAPGQSNGNGNGNNSIDPMIFYIGIPVASVAVIALGVVFYLRHKKKKAFF